jgi:NAD(P)-dependent dehydrogenase (short-subunit alcohol dehydrogenase family)
MMQFGVTMFPSDYAMNVVDLGRAAEDHGFESLFIPEHTHIPVKREMIGQGSGGTIVNLSSVHGFAAVPNRSHYEASKGGINMFTKACAIELARLGIQVNAIAPGAIEVERYFDMPGYDREDWGKRIPAGRGLPG